ncbi:MAG: HlyD family efflux transporter periplasmic adaptor subunit, partial [Planctomycetales bacterium]|nr:HlyD family efflux transporter periplasmic adaptor subunit [Planctomycetales bacterium]
RGETLLTIDPRNYELTVHRLEKEAAQAVAELEELDVEIANVEELVALAKSQLELERNNLSRSEQLNQRGAVTDAEVDRARQSELTVRNSLTTQTSQLRLLATRKRRLELAGELVRTRLAQARLDLERTQIVAPVDGVVASAPVEQDSYVAVGAELLTVEDTSAVEVVCPLRVEELELVLQQTSVEPDASASDMEYGYRLPATPATIIYDAGDRRYAWNARLDRYDGVGVDPRTRTAAVRLVADAPQSPRILSDGEASSTRGGGVRALVRGMYVQVVLHIEPQSQWLSLPRQAVQPGKRAWFVREGKLHLANLGDAYPHDDELLFDARDVELKPGDRVVTSPLAAPSEGMPVREANQL